MNLFTLAVRINGEEFLVMALATPSGPIATPDPEWFTNAFQKCYEVIGRGPFPDNPEFYKYLEHIALTQPSVIKFRDVDMNKVIRTWQVSPALMSCQVNALGFPHLYMKMKPGFTAKHLHKDIFDDIQKQLSVLKDGTILVQDIRVSLPDKFGKHQPVEKMDKEEVDRILRDRGLK